MTQSIFSLGLRRIYPFKPDVHVIEALSAMTNRVPKVAGRFVASGFKTMVACISECILSLCAADQAAMRRYHTVHYPRSHLGTMCSGTDGIVVVADAYKTAVSSVLSVPFTVSHEFASDSDDKVHGVLD